jgi:LuxR family transcriptional regulator, maltose regulon positive regulatory protein
MVTSAPIPAMPIPGTRAGLPVYIPPPPLKVVARTRLIEQLNERVRVSAGGTPGVTLISVAAGFGKTTLVSEWVASGS